MRSDRTRKDTAKRYIAVLALLLFCSIVFNVQTHYQRTTAIRPEDDYRGRISQFHSSVDRDDDGVDDQLDILNGALAYVSTHPKYKSRYYETGYPDDGYGVCTDVVAYALKNAGYNLQELVDADIREQPQDYMVEEPDANIDFRRVRNLKVFFAHTAAALTTDVSEIEEWQGGDIVIFERLSASCPTGEIKTECLISFTTMTHGRQLTNRTFWKNEPTSWGITGFQNKKASPLHCA